MQIHLKPVNKKVRALSELVVHYYIYVAVTAVDA
jgi:hypothetical protein